MINTRLTLLFPKKALKKRNIGEVTENACQGGRFPLKQTSAFATGGRVL